MLFKIGLPNPYQSTPKEFFTQIRIAIKATEKAYEEATKNLTEEEKENYWIGFYQPDLSQSLKEKLDLDTYAEEAQDIELHFGN